jgi:Sec-independent protein translocase protein TatA
MKRLAALLLLALVTVTASLPAYARKENKSIGENGKEARRASKQYQKYAKKQSKRQQKAMKKYQKAQRKASKHQQHHG